MESIKQLMAMNDAGGRDSIFFLPWVKNLVPLYLFHGGLALAAVCEPLPHALMLTAIGEFEYCWWLWPCQHYPERI